MKTIFFTLLEFWDFLRETFWQTIAFLTFEYDNYEIIKACGAEIDYYSLYFGVLYAITEELTPEEAEKNKDPNVELMVGQTLERVPELKAQLQEVRTRVFKRKKNKLLRNLSELEEALKEVKEKIGYRRRFEKWKQALEAENPKILRHRR